MLKHHEKLNGKLKECVDRLNDLVLTLTTGNTLTLMVPNGSRGDGSSGGGSNARTPRENSRTSSRSPSPNPPNSAAHQSLTLSGGSVSGLLNVAPDDMTQASIHNNNGTNNNSNATSHSKRRRGSRTLSATRISVDEEDGEMEQI
jgi:hypothetical protein